MDIRDEIKYTVDANFSNFTFNSPDLPISRNEFIDVLTDEFERLFNEYLREKMMESLKDPINRHIFN